jgi:ABC-type antimicrobial peptide transport system permease subunit
VNPVGRLIKFGDERSAASWVRVTGVVKDVLDPKAHDLDEFYGRHPAGVYRTFSSEDTSRVAAASMTIYAHATGDGDRVAVSVRHMLADLPDLGNLYVATFDESNGTRRRRAQDDFMAMIFSLFGIVALGLAAVGVYGIVSHSVNERRREFGVRISLGATTKDILLNVLGEGNVFALSGVAVGLYLARGTAHWVGMFMTEMHDLDDAGLYAAVASVLVVTAFIGAIGPAWRATRIAPVEAMRNE